SSRFKYTTHCGLTCHVTLPAVTRPLDLISSGANSRAAWRKVDASFRITRMAKGRVMTIITAQRQAVVRTGREDLLIAVPVANSFSVAANQTTPARAAQNASSPANDRST